MIERKKFEKIRFGFAVCLFTGLSSAFVSFSALSSPLKFGLLLDKGGKDDKSFNAAAFAGASKAKEELGIQLKVVEASDDNSYEPQLRNFVRAKFDLIVAVGFAQGEALKKVALANPKSNFVIIDFEVRQANVKAVLFEEHEGSFLAGALAAMHSKSNTVGFLGGMDIPLIRRFEMAYFAGAKHINPKLKTVSNFVGVTGEAWNNPAKAKELTLAQISKNVDVVFGAAGASTMGMLDAAAEKKKLAIGVDSNQNGLKPGTVLTSMMKRVDVAVYNAMKESNEGKFKGGVQRMGLKDDGVALAFDEYNSKIVSSADREKIEKLKAEIISGKTSVPDFYTTSKK